MEQLASLDRRGVMKGSGLAAFALATPLTGLMATQAAAASDPQGAQLDPAASPYGPIFPVNDLATGLPLLKLPRGFTYRTFSWTGDLMNDGNRVSDNHDGMEIVRTTGTRTKEYVLIRNHELGAGPRTLVPGNPAAIYDALGTEAAGLAGGCSVLRVKNGQLVDHRNSLGGTIVNCAGGATLWNSWLTCEETTQDLTAQGGKKHGYIFDVSSNPLQTVATPLVHMGRFAHEAVASDPVTGFIYHTEDSRNNASFYRTKPADNSRTYGSLANGGTLQVAKVVGIDNANFLALSGIRPSSVDSVGQVFQIEWVDIANPDADPAPYTETGVNNPDTGVRTVSGPHKQSREAGGLRMSRGEGIWQHNNVFYYTDTSFGYEPTGTPPRAGRGLGAVWAYRPNRNDETKGTLTLVYAAAARIAGNNPDNITVSPTGGVLYFEDGAAVVDQFGAGNRIMGLTPAGLAYIFAKNNVELTDAQIAAMGRTGQIPAGDYRGQEFAGGTFTPDGRTLFCNIQTPGITLAITGPWARGNL